ncbi:MAG: aldolase/citrate lyase family protein [Dehalococcoidia bacterium]
MVAVRSILLIRGTQPAVYEAAATTSADAVVIDLASPEVSAEREAARALAAKHAPLIARRGRGAHVRISDARSGELEADVEAVAGAAIAAVLLSGAEEPQDVRDADIALRRREMRRKVAPGHMRLIPEVDSAAGLRALPAMLGAVDRHGAAALNVEALAHDMGLGGALAPSMPLLEHAMATVAFAARAAKVPWLLLASHVDQGIRAALANRAHALGAGGVYVRSEAEAAGFRQLFTPARERVELARAMLEEWERVRTREEWVGAVHGQLVDRRSVRLARQVVAADAEHRTLDEARRR